jgi:hypothetical protein
MGRRTSYIMNRLFGSSNQRLLDTIDNQVNILKSQLMTKDAQLAAKDAQFATQLAAKDAQLAAKDAQLAAKDAQFATQLNAKDDQLAAKDAQFATQLAAKDAQFATQLKAKDDRVDQLHRQVIDAIPKITHFQLQCRKFSSMVFANEASRNVRGALEWMARMIHRDNVPDPKHGFPGVQAVLDKYVLTDAVFQSQLDVLSRKYHTDDATMKRRFKAIFDTVSKEHHGSDVTLCVPHSKFPCQGDRLILCAIFEYYGFPYEVLDDAAALEEPDE